MVYLKKEKKIEKKKIDWMVCKEEDFALLETLLNAMWINSF